MIKAFALAPRYTWSMARQRKKPDAGLAIRRFRQEKGLSQEGLADRMDVSASYISMLESGKRYPSIEMLIRIAHALEISPGDMLNLIAERYTERNN